MAIPIITKEDFQQFKTEVLEGIKNLLQGKTTEHKLWFRISGGRKMLNSSQGALRNLRINRTISYSKVGGTLCYNHGDIGICLQTSNIPINYEAS